MRHLSAKIKRRIPVFITNMATDVMKDGHVTMRKLALAHDVSMRMIHNTLHQDLNLPKKSA
jgi:hypothetical protein